MAHTPELWRLGWGRADYLDIEAYFPDDEAWYAIASIDLGEHGGKPTPEQEANARLIARAPELQAESDRRLALLRRGLKPLNSTEYQIWVEDVEKELADGCELAAELKENHNGGDYGTKEDQHL